MEIFLVSICSGVITGLAKWIPKWGGGEGVGGGAWNTEKYCRPPWLADNKKFSNSRDLTLE